MSPLELNWDELQQLVSLFEGYNLTELILEEDGLRLVLRARSEAIPAASAAPPGGATAIPACSPSPVKATPEAATIENRVPIVAPMVGVFYRAASPDAPPFIEVGDHIEVGQTIGMIEAMKVFSEIPSEVAGEVVDIPAQNGQLVQQGDTIVMVKAGETHG